MNKFKLVSPFTPKGDQPKAIKKLVKDLLAGEKSLTLLGVTGSGKTFTIANVIEQINKPVLVISHNKTLAAQLYSELKEFFPNNAVEYFISYYDYYQPEAYIPSTDTYIEKDASINEHIDRLRLKATSSLLSRRDVIVVASVSCIYNIGSPEDFENMGIVISVGEKRTIEDLTAQLVKIRYERNNIDFSRNRFRFQGEILDIWPSYLERFIRIKMEDEKVTRITEHNPTTAEVLRSYERIYIYPASHFVTSSSKFLSAIESIERELEERLNELREQGKLLESQRLEQRTKNDLELLRETGFCHGIENYSRHFSGRPAGSRPYCLIDYFPKDFLCIVDESHATIPQIRGMYEGDRSRKETLIEYGFRLPSALDNRPLKFDEFIGLLNQVIFVSATPSEWEINFSKGKVVEQIIRPTGLVDPEVVIKPAKRQVQDVILEIKKVIEKKQRVLITTLTKRLAEDLTEYLQSQNFRVKYIHSNIDALTRIEIIRELRKGDFDCLVGVNLLREGLDLPEVSLVAILDADKEGFLRNQTTLIQIAGRAARNIDGRIILYADKKTNSILSAVREMDRRRKIQQRYNKKYNIIPRTIVKSVKELEEFQVRAKTKHFAEVSELKSDYFTNVNRGNINSLKKFLEQEMIKAAELLDFETAIIYRDKLKMLEEMRVENKKG